MNLASILQEVQQYNIFVDLDGVITDFDSRYAHYTGVSPEEMDTELTKQYGKKKAQSMFWSKVDGVGSKFWEDMEYMPDAQQLINFLKPYKYKFLSSPSRSATSKEGKTNWAKREFPNIELILRIASQKQEFSGPKNILIDDRPSNIEQWKAKGGVGILHKSASDTIKQLEKLGFKKGSVDEIQIQSTPPNPDYQKWLDFYKEYKETVEKSGFKSLDDVENSFEEIREKISNALKINLNKKHKGSFQWSEYELDDEIWHTAQNRFEYKYGLNSQEFEYFFSGLRKWKNKTELDEIQVGIQKPINFKRMLNHDTWGSLRIKDVDDRWFGEIINNYLIVEFNTQEEWDDNDIDIFQQVLSSKNIKSIFKTGKIAIFKIPLVYVDIEKPELDEIQIKPTKPIIFEPNISDDNFGTFKIRGESTWWGGELENNKTILQVEFDIDAGDEEDRDDYENEASLFGSLLKQKGIKYKYIKDRYYRTYLIPMVYVDIVKELNEIQVSQPLNFSDKNLYMGTYKGGSKEIDELMRADQVANLYNLGSYVTFRPSGALNSKTFLMPKRYFELDAGGRPVDTESDLRWIQKAIKGNIYQKLK